MMPRPKKMGRPELPNGELRDEWLKIRVNRKEKRKIQADAKKERKKTAAYVRGKLGLE